jgi:hypothetical protein
MEGEQARLARDLIRRQLLSRCAYSVFGIGSSSDNPANTKLYRILDALANKVVENA